MPRQSKKPVSGMVDPRDLTSTSPHPDYDDIDASDEAEMSKRMTGEPAGKTRARSARQKGAISRISKAEADRPRRKTRGGTGPH